jgi:hypothetical protein
MEISFGYETLLLIVTECIRLVRLGKMLYFNFRTCEFIMGRPYSFVILSACVF